MSLTIASALWAGWMVSGIAREHHHGQRRDAIPHRVLVGGVRGKSSLVRLVHFGLNQSAIRTTARISGDKPTIIQADGSEAASPRRGDADIIELYRLFSHEMLRGIDAAVIENMAIRPELAGVVAKRIVKPTLQLLATDAPDHLDVYPLDRTARARMTLDAMDKSVPLIIAPSPANDRLIEEARAQGFNLVPATPSSRIQLRPFMSSLLGAGEAALAHIGVDLAVIRDGLDQEAARLQRLRSYRIANGSRVLDFLSANDPASTLSLARMAEREFAIPSEKCALLFVHRADRATRLLSFLPLFLKYRTYVTGDRPPRSVTAKHPLTFLPRVDWSALADNPLVFLGGNATKTGETLRAQLAASGEAQTW